METATVNISNVQYFHKIEAFCWGSVTILNSEIKKSAACKNYTTRIRICAAFVHLQLMVSYIIRVSCTAVSKT